MLFRDYVFLISLNLKEKNLLLYKKVYRSLFIYYHYINLINNIKII